MAHTDLDYVIPTIQVDPAILDKLDSKNSSREKDGQTIKMPSQSNIIPIQLWEVYFAVGVLLLQPPSNVVVSHVKALCEHTEERHLCETILREHTFGIVADVSQDISWYTFFEEYMFRKFNVNFIKGTLLKYLTDTIEDPLCGRNNIPRSFHMGPFVQNFLLNTAYFDSQYDELVDSMRMYNLPLFDVLAQPEADFGESKGIDWDAVRLYDDPNMVLKKYGGWALTKGLKMVTPKDSLIIKLTGLSLDQILSNTNIPDSPRGEDDGGGDKTESARKRDVHGNMERRGKMRISDASKDDESDDSSHPSDFDVEPEHPKVMPFGVTICEAYCLLRGALVANEGGWEGCIVRDPFHSTSQDGHMLAAAVLIDLYMREQVDLHHWTLSGGNVAVPYRCQLRKGRAPMEHYLDKYRRGVDATFREMRLPSGVGDYPIWCSLEDRGILDNHRVARRRAFGCGWQRLEVWDLARPDLLHDLKNGYLTGARVLYDKSVEDPLDEAMNDALMFCFCLQCLFDSSFEALDGMARVLKEWCPPFEKGELYAPLTMVHAGAVCAGLADRAFRVARHEDTQIAMEAAEYNEIIMERFEEKFFLSEKAWESFDVDGSGELTLEEFVEGMRNIDIYKDFRKERIPDAVLRMIVSDLAERLFFEVDVNGDGSLTADELASAFKRRRTEALREQERRQWARTMVKNIAMQVGGRKEEDATDPRVQAVRYRDSVQRKERVRESRRTREWSSEVEKAHLLDEDVDLNAPLPSF
eukprot:TRINITY_DN25884_c0_g1_i1.p1 TRINITY_DN25884_c0_g1~~TRINITY_DN25884_c0_g1_i1.p1  ORF type:complete len:754 (+),score=197.78 TRINITY_DN25884_c0_g1_i1:152-2413(+)